ncbi:YkvA family protein [Roseibium sp.]|uniref:YkvA family protein n=1 Tax=Roseibium sp. TaxID=1936156 RepID=UPI003A971E28
MADPFENLDFDTGTLGSEAEQKQRLRDKLARTALKAARQIPFMEDVVASYYCALDPKTPAKVRATALAALAYFVLPTDVIPDFLIGIGFGDDAGVLMAAITMMRAYVRDEHVDAARRTLDSGNLEDQA